MNSNEQRIREFAYQIWQSEGKPHGHAKRHWEMACKLAESDVQQSGSKASPKAKTASKKSLQTSEITPLEKPVKKTKTAETESAATTAKTDAAKKPKTKPAETKVKATANLEVKKPAAAKKTSISEIQPM